MAQWEYKIVDLSDGGGFFSGSSRPTESELNDLGADSWELAASLTGSKTGLGGRPKAETNALVFKRRVEECRVE